MKSKRPLKIKTPDKTYPTRKEMTDHGYKYGWNEALDADTEWFLGVLEGLKVTVMFPTTNQNSYGEGMYNTYMELNEKIDQAIKEIKEGE